MTAAEMRSVLWLHLWRRRLWPFDGLTVGDTLLWYQSSSRALLWKTTVVDCDAFFYFSKEHLLSELEDGFGIAPARNNPVIWNAPWQGKCLAYRVEPLVRAFVPRPPHLSFSRSGWMVVDTPASQAWAEGIDDPQNQLPFEGPQPAPQESRASVRRRGR